jgi:ribosomal protein S18 acetylase RimI-like enzyme
LKDDRKSNVLKPFEYAHAATVLGWVATPEELFHWSARADFPLRDQRVFEQWHGDPDVRAFLDFAGDVLQAYGELWFDEQDGAVELGRLIVAPAVRKQGIGSALVTQLVAVAREADYAEAWVRVFPTNDAALACYASAGFVAAHPARQAELNAAQRFEFVWMQRRVDSQASAAQV